MKKFRILGLGLIAVFLFINWKDALISGGGDIFTAATITNEELIQMSRDMRAVGDKENTVPSSGNKYAQRLAKMTNKLKKEEGLDLNFKVYITKDVNANATADGSIRVYSGLMDMMNDDELFYVVGHEIGHVKNQDALKQIRTIYLSSGAIKAAAASNKKAGALTNTQLGDLLHSALNAQYSQKAEYAADNYGYNLMKKYKINTNGAVTALYKIDSLGASGGVMSSHPNSADRAKKLEDLIKKEK